MGERIGAKDYPKFIRTISLTLVEKAVLDELANRWKIGRARYGEGIKHTQQESIEGWLNNAIEEAADLLQYLISMRVMIKHDRLKAAPRRHKSM